MIFFITFGSDHVGKAGGFAQASTDGWLSIEAPSEDTARAVAFAVLGRNWAMIYSQKPSIETYKLGELGRMRISVDVPRLEVGTESGMFLHSKIVEALHLTPDTPDEQLHEFDRDFRVPSWMREARGWLVRNNSDAGQITWVHPADFAYDYEPVPTEGAAA